MRTFLAYQLSQQHPPDTHPLAREDGGWYPGKPFDPTDILTDPRNWQVWKQFLTFFFAILFVPVLTFIGLEWVLRRFGGLKPQQSQTIGCVCAIIVLQFFMFYYARQAVTEERADYAAQEAATLSSTSPGTKKGDEDESESEGKVEKVDEAVEKSNDGLIDDLMPREEEMPEKSEEETLKKRK